jgi:hypothetical protein
MKKSSAKSAGQQPSKSNPSSNAAAKKPQSSQLSTDPAKRKEEPASRASGKQGKVSADRADAGRPDIDEPSSALPEAPEPSVVMARAQLGEGDTLFIRGSGAGLNWERGEPMSKINEDTWTWSSVDLSEPIEFKVLVNDQAWAQGENLQLEAKQRREFWPSF